MRDAAVFDLEQLGIHEVFAFPDKAAPVEPQWFSEVAQASDRVLLIAPESDGILLDLHDEVYRVRSRTLGPSRAAIVLTSDKLALASHWREQGIPTPDTTDRLPTQNETFPVVWKPRDGAGSAHTYLLRDGIALTQALQCEQSLPMILQEHVPGRAASVAFLCGPREIVSLTPAFQLLTDDGRFQYRGGELPIPPELAARAVLLASRAVACVPGLLGFVGVDLVLGDEEDGSRDFAIEINPRLTTSYVGLRGLADFNLAQALLKVVEGESFGPLHWKARRMGFGAEGKVWAL